MENAIPVDDLKILKWMENHSSQEAIEKELKSSSYSDSEIAIYIQAFIRAKRAKRQWTGFVLIIVGAILGFISCLLAIINPVPDLFHVFLYGLTPISAIILFAGLFLVFE